MSDTQVIIECPSCHANVTAVKDHVAEFKGKRRIIGFRRGQVHCKWCQHKFYPGNSILICSIS